MGYFRAWRLGGDTCKGAGNDPGTDPSEPGDELHLRGSRERSPGRVSQHLEAGGICEVPEPEWVPCGRGASPPPPSLPTPHHPPFPGLGTYGQEQERGGRCRREAALRRSPRHGAGGLAGGAPRGWRFPLSRSLRAAPALASPPTPPRCCP